MGSGILGPYVGFLVRHSWIPRFLPGRYRNPADKEKNAPSLSAYTVVSRKLNASPSTLATVRARRHAAENARAASSSRSTLGANNRSHFFRDAAQIYLRLHALSDSLRLLLCRFDHSSCAHSRLRGLRARAPLLLQFGRMHIHAVG